jgi:hypothetical protein
MPTVVLYGNSLIVSTFGASLEGRPGLRLLRVETSTPGADQRLGAMRPDIVIFDLATEHTDFAISLWKTLPDLLLIGVTPDSSQMLVLSGRQQQALSVEDLLSIIQGENPRMKDPQSESFKGESHEKREVSN